MNKIYSDYDNFAYFYNKYWTVSAPLYLESALIALLFDKIPANASILDVCCGTGNIAGLLQQRGYDVTGLDGSAAMLHYASLNAPSSSFIRADARDFNINKRFDACICLFDSINHILEQDGLKAVFKNIHAHLKDGGIFIFDVNSETSSEEAEFSDFTSVEDDSVFITKANYDKQKRIITYNLTAFIKEKNSWLREDYQVFERYYGTSELLKAVNEAGFINSSFTDGRTLGIEAFQDRIFWTVWK